MTTICTDDLRSDRRLVVEPLVSSVSRSKLGDSQDSHRMQRSHDNRWRTQGAMRKKRWLEGSAPSMKTFGCAAERPGLRLSAIAVRTSDNG